jgi:hypothetical protein
MEVLNTAPGPVPNSKPAGVSEWVHSMVGQSKTMQCLLYGVQNPDAGKWKVEGKGKWEYQASEDMGGKTVMGK